MTFAGVALPGATVDLWEDDSGNAQWSARIVTRLKLASEAGELTGHTADGRAVAGQVLVAGREVGSVGRRETLVEFHGSGELTVSDRPGS